MLIVVIELNSTRMVRKSQFPTGSSERTPTRFGGQTTCCDQNDIGRGSFALHANLFRYALLFKLGGWWIDHDVVLLSPELPKEEIFFSIETLDPMRATFSVLKFPAGHPAMGEALEKCAALAETAAYGQTGADLFTEMVAKYDLVKFGQAMEMTYSI